METIEALGRIVDPRAVAPLTKALQDENGYVRIQAARVLIRMGEPEDEVLSAFKEPQGAKFFIDAQRD